MKNRDQIANAIKLAAGAAIFAVIAAVSVWRLLD